MTLDELLQKNERELSGHHASMYKAWMELKAKQELEIQVAGGSTAEIQKRHDEQAKNFGREWGERTRDLEAKQTSSPTNQYDSPEQEKDQNQEAQNDTAQEQQDKTTDQQSKEEEQQSEQQKQEAEAQKAEQEKQQRIEETKREIQRQREERAKQFAANRKGMDMG